MKGKHLRILVGAVLLTALGISGLALWSRRPGSTSAADAEAVAYVLKVDGRWRRQGAIDDLKDGEELRVGDSLSPVSADTKNALTVYVFGKGAHTISEQEAPYRVVRSLRAAAGPADLLTSLLPRVKEVFPEQTISRGDNDQPLGGPLSVSEQGLDLTPLRHGNVETSKTRSVRLRLLKIPFPPAASPDAKRDARGGRGDSLEFAYRWDPRQLGVVSGTSALEPGLYRLQVWAAPRKGQSLPPIDSDAFPDDEFLVLIVKNARAFQEARRDYESVAQSVQREWDENVPAEIRTAFLKACLLRLAEQNAATSGDR